MAGILVAKAYNHAKTLVIRRGTQRRKYNSLGHVVRILSSPRDLVFLEKILSCQVLNLTAYRVLN